MMPSAAISNLVPSALSGLVATSTGGHPWRFDWGLDLFPLAAAVLAAVTCGVLGNFLVLRKLSLMGDAISHSVLPGLVIAFLIASTRDPLAMFGGAAIAGLVTVILVEVVKRLGRVEPGAAMGVVFSVLFALGVLLIEQAARHVDLDSDCVLHGQLETLVWYGAPGSFGEVFRLSTLEHVPRQVTVLAVMALGSLLFVGLFFKELRIAAFDPALATTQGFSAGVMHALLMIFVAGATVASFEAVGSILVIAMLICPAATARLLTDRLLPQILVSLAVAAFTAIVGYVAASAVPALWEMDSVNAAGSMSVVAGVVLAIAVVASPRHGMVTRVLRRRALAASVAQDDLLAALHRAAESGRNDLERVELEGPLVGRRLAAALASASRSGLIDVHDDRVALTDRGRAAAAEVIRRHRLWQDYLVDEVGLAPDHAHLTAEQLEHLELLSPLPALRERVPRSGG